MITEKDKIFMGRALSLARKAYMNREIPVGAVVVDKGQVIGEGYNRQNLDKDPTAHAEIVALREASIKKNRFRLDGAKMYVTVNPCIMCKEAIKRARISEVYYSSPRAKAATHKVAYKKTSYQMDESSNILRGFFKDKR